MESILVDDAAEKFQLPQIRETIAGITDCIALLLRVPKATAEEVEAIAKPASTLLARRPQIQNAVKKYAAPAVLLGAIGSYVVPRLIALRLRSMAGHTHLPPVGADSTDRSAQTPAASPQTAPPAIDSPASPVAGETGSPPPAAAAEAAAIASFAQSVLDSERARTLSYG